MDSAMSQSCQRPAAKARRQRSEVPVRYAIIGCGRISANHIEAAKNNRLKIAAICDLVPERMDALAARCGLSCGVARYADYTRLLDQERPDVVAVATESGTHAAIAADCIRAGCHVIIEKPIALSLADAEGLIALARGAGVWISVCHQNRFNKSVQYVRRALEGGRFGRLLHGSANVLWHRGEDYYASAPWRGTWAQDGGVLMNQCIHNLDILRWMLGNDIREVFAYTDRLKHPCMEAEDFGAALIHFQNGAYGIAQGTSNVYPANLEETLYLFGERATVKLGGKSVNIIEEWQLADGLDSTEAVKAAYGENPPNIYGYGHTPLYADMIDAIGNHRAPYVSGEDGLRALELVLAIYRSADEGRPVRLPLPGGSTLDFQGRFGGGVSRI